MAYDDLRDWIAALDRAGELKKIKTEVDPILEIAEITDRVSKNKWRPGVLARRASAAFSKHQEPSWRASPDQSIWLRPPHESRLEVDKLDEVADRIRQFMDVKSPQGFLDKVKMLPMLAEMGKFFPKTVSTGPCKEVIRRDNFSLDWFPILQCWPKDAGRFITLPCVITRDPRTGKRNVGMYRMQVYDSQTTGMHWQRQKVAAEHYRERMRSSAGAGAVDLMARSSGGSVVPDGDRPAGKMEVAVAIGTDPAITFSAIVPAPPDVEEYLIAGFLRQKPVELVKCETVDLEVPASSEIVLEGHVNLDELRTEGPFRRSHRLLLARRSLSRLSSHLHHPPQKSDLLDDHRRQAPNGRWLDGQSRRTHFSAADEAHHPGDRRHQSPRRRHLSQPDDRLHQEVLSRPGAQGDERRLVARPGHVHQMHHRGR